MLLCLPTDVLIYFHISYYTAPSSFYGKVATYFGLVLFDILICLDKRFIEL